MSETIYLAVQARNSNQLNTQSIDCNINQQTNPIVKNLSDYDVYLTSFTSTTAELPYFNIRRQIIDFTTNCTNMSISLLAQDDTSRPFDLAGNNNLLLQGIGNNTGDTWQGARCFLQYTTENSTLEDPSNDGAGANSSGYPRSYFNVHSINQFIDMINVALNTMFELIAASDAANNNFFSYEPTSQNYYYNTNVIYMPGGATPLDTYTNGFLEHRLDAFRWKYQKESIINPNDLAAYDGLDYLFIPTLYPYLKDSLATDFWSLISEYSCIANLLDVHSILITANAGSLQQLRQQVVPTNQTNSNTNDLPTIAVLKNLDIDFSSLTLSSINNTFIQYESPGLFFPINGIGKNALTNINISVFIQTIDNEIYPLTLNSGGGYSNIKFALKKKSNI